MAKEDTVDQDVNAAWEVESGLIDDVDGWIANPRFGFKEEYAQAVVATGAVASGAMFLVDILDEKGEIQGSQGYSIGTGWEISDDGRYISHPKRKNVVGSSLYGQLQTKVVKDLGLDMGKRGDPTDAMSWDKLGFHWNLAPHTTVSGEEKFSLMPSTLLEKASPEAVPGSAPAATTPAAAAPAAGTVNAKVEALKLVATSANAKEFIMKAVKVPAIVADDAFMVECTDDGDAGFYAQNKA